MVNNACPCSGNTLDRLVRPSVMAVLARHPEGLHGYALTQQLSGLAIFHEIPPDTTGLYRVLKAMELEGYLESNWQIDTSGPARKVYTLTQPGWGCLQQWLGTLQVYAQNLSSTLEYIEESLGASTANSAPE